MVNTVGIPGGGRARTFSSTDSPDHFFAHPLDLVLVPDSRNFCLRPSACPGFPRIFTSDLVLVLDITGIFASDLVLVPDFTGIFASDLVLVPV